MVASDLDFSWLSDCKADPVTYAQHFTPDGYSLPTTNCNHGRIC